jgi:hypothetical protein
MRVQHAMAAYACLRCQSLSSYAGLAASCVLAATQRTSHPRDVLGTLTAMLPAGCCAPTGGANVVTGPIVDWCFDYGEKPGIWVTTEHAW